MAKKNLAPAAPEASEATYEELPPSPSDDALERASDVSDAARRTAKAARELRRATLMARGALNSPSIDTPPAPPPILPEISRLDNILAQITDEGKFEVHRQVGGSSMKVGVFPIAEYPDRLETIAAEYKGGTFKITFKNPGGQIKGQDTQTFDAKAYGSERTDPARESEDRSSHIMERMMERLEAREIEQRREMAEVRLESQRMMLEMMKLASGNQNQNQGLGVIDAIKLGKEMAGSASDPVESMSRLMEAMALMKDGVGKSEPQSPIVFAIEKALEMVSPIVAVWAQKASASPRANPPVPAPGAEAPRRELPPPAARVTPPAQAASPAPLPAQPLPSSPLPIDPKVKEYADQLLAAAKTGMRPSLLSQLIVDSLPEEGFQAFEEMLDDEQTITNLLNAEPQLTPYAGWLSTLMVELRDYFDSITAEDPTDGPLDATPPAPAPAPSAPVEAVVSTAEIMPPAPVGARNQ